MASERESMEARRWAMPAAKSWYVAFGCTAERKAFGSKDLEVIRIAAPAQVNSSKLCTSWIVAERTNGIPYPCLSH